MEMILLQLSFYIKKICIDTTQTKSTNTEIKYIEKCNQLHHLNVVSR